MADFGTIAKPYARALFDVASATGDADAWSQALAAAASVVADPASHAYLGRPGLGAGDRARFVADVCGEIDAAGKLASAEGMNLLRLLAENDRLSALSEVSAQFDELKAEAENRIQVVVTSAVPVDDELGAQLKQSLESKLGRTVELALETDPSLVGGAVIRAEDMVIDGSVRNRLRRLTDALID
jgi:F-type H+-transporting ATPase subunit delta